MERGWALPYIKGLGSPQLTCVAPGKSRTQFSKAPANSKTVIFCGLHLWCKNSGVGCPDLLAVLSSVPHTALDPRISLSHLILGTTLGNRQDWDWYISNMLLPSLPCRFLKNPQIVSTSLETSNTGPGGAWGYRELGSSV